jgi:hypothetical protein
MTSGLPPIPPAFDPEIEAARGTIRDALGGLHNLRQLLRSVRVGPKALSAVIPDVQASCVPLTQAVRRLLMGLPAFMPEGSGADLEQFVGPRIDELESTLGTLGRRRRSALKASERLELERVVSAIASDLGTALNLLDVLFDAEGGGRVAVDAVELLHECAHPTDTTTPGARAIRVTFTKPSPPATVEVNARAAIALITAAIGTTALALGVDHVEAELATESVGVFRYRFSRATADRPEALTVLVPPMSPALRVGPRALAGALGGTYRARPAETVVTLPAPAAQ